VEEGDWDALGVSAGGSRVVVSGLISYSIDCTDLDRHLGTGTGAYFYIVWGIWLRHCLNYKQDDYELYWPNWYTLPLVVRKQKSGANGYANGHANGHTNGSAKKEL